MRSDKRAPPAIIVGETNLHSNLFLERKFIDLNSEDIIQMRNARRLKDLTFRELIGHFTRKI